MFRPGIPRKLNHVPTADSKFSAGRGAFVPRVYPGEALSGCALISVLVQNFSEIRQSTADLINLKWPSAIRVNAAGVAGVATPQYLTCRGRPVLTTHQYFDKCFIFFLSAELLNTTTRCHFHLQCAPQFFEHNY